MNSGSGGKQGFMEAGTKGWVVLTWWIKGRGMVHSGAPGQSKSWRCGTLHVRPPDATGRWCRNWRGCGWVGSIRRPYWSRSGTWHRRKRRATCSAVVRGQHTVQPARGTERTLGAHGGEAGEETTRYAEQRGPGISGPQSSWQRERGEDSLRIPAYHCPYVPRGALFPMSDPVPEFRMVSRWLLWEAGCVRPGVCALESACLTGPLFPTYSGENLGRSLNLSALYLTHTSICADWDTVPGCPVTKRVRLTAALWTVTRQAPLSMECPGQEYWRGLPFPTPGDLPDAGIEPVSPAWQVDALVLRHQASLLTLQEVTH